ncbi:MAG: PorV/PorQ family protein [Gemmatimonadota bacterium]|nr:PorV/PorQ family protein [Gemmatimonadota bacterium]MDH3426812.1 PorV/PorQ family protein [Gemmatimonadota bacterium]
MRLLSRMAIAFTATVALPGLLWAQDNPVQIEGDNTSFGGVSAEFLQFGAGARGMALGGGFSTIADDVSALHYNPAGITFMDGPEASLTVMPYFADTDYYWAGLAFPFGDGDFGFGVSLAHFGFSDQPIFTEADEQGDSGEFYGVSETSAALTIAHAFIDRFSAGFTVKFITDDLATGALAGASASAVAFDFGVNFHSELGDKPIALSFVVQNLGGTLSHSGDALRFRDFDGSTNDPSLPDQRVDPIFAEIVTDGFPLPRLFRAGLSYDIVSGDNTRLTLLSEFVEANNTQPSFGFGGEFEWMSDVSPIGAALRGSYATQPDNDDLGGLPCGCKDNLDGLGVGGGIFYQIADEYRVKFDYAFRHFGTLGSVDVFSVTFGWD